LRRLLDIAGLIAFALVVLIMFGLFVSLGRMAEGQHRTVMYDCRLAEISPDFPPEVKEACRKRFMTVK
jgi:hypothetical protein